MEKQNDQNVYRKESNQLNNGQKTEEDWHETSGGIHEINEDELELIEEYLNTVDRYLAVINTGREIKKSIGEENPEEWQRDYQNELRAELPKLQFKIATIAKELDIQFTFNELELLENKQLQLEDDLDKEINIDIKHKLSIELAGVVDRINSLK